MNDVLSSVILSTIKRFFHAKTVIVTQMIHQC